MAPQWQLERIEVSVAAMLSRVAQAGECQMEYDSVSTSACQLRWIANLLVT